MTSTTNTNSGSIIDLWTTTDPNLQASIRDNDLLEIGNPRHRIIGGYVMSTEEIRSWARRIIPFMDDTTPMEETPTGLSIASQLLNIYFKEDIYMRPVEETFGPEPYYMILTQTGSFEGKVGMDPSEIPQFVPGDNEKPLHEFLVEQGVYG
ncbi:hypothetical protein H0H81_006854 [Sphagnurus paluster]|uniref:Uncharacterized protein n=1 Tax=Sphagnurus paluster TaxID=117069 RepID=A0A9P7GQ08_9AGAR|nr:hypothetical protein H0H81_006854 [Sphagnurus paluster]